MDKPIISKEKIKTLFETKFLKMYDLNYAEGRHYFVATRNSLDNMVAVKSDSEFTAMLPDAVTCIVIVKEKEKEPKLLLTYEYRYPTGRFLLSPPAGLIDPEDKAAECPQIVTAIREIKEETGLTVKDTDTVRVITPLSFSTPGMTDESNGLVLAVIEVDNLESINQDGTVGSELITDYKLIDREEAKHILERGRDEFDNFYSIYTWAALMYFVSDMWK